MPIPIPNIILLHILIGFLSAKLNKPKKMTLDKEIPMIGIYNKKIKSLSLIKASTIKVINIVGYVVKQPMQKRLSEIL